MKLMEIEIGENTYQLGFPTRKDALIAEERGLNIVGGADKVLTLTTNLFYTGLIARQPKITKEQSLDLMQQYIDEGGDIEETTQFLSEQYMAFMVSPNGKKKKKAKIVEM